jgi:hypothetical protein
MSERYFLVGAKERRVVLQGCEADLREVPFNRLCRVTQERLGAELTCRALPCTDKGHCNSQSLYKMVYSSL